MAELREARREIRAAVHQHEEGAGDRPPPYRFHRVVETTLVFRKRIALNCV
jgi:hypothetical protein